MPKTSQPRSVKLRKYVREFGDSVFTIEGDTLICKLCSTTVNIQKRYYVMQHVKSARHRNSQYDLAEDRASTSQKVDLPLSPVTKDKFFHQDLCRTFVKAGIPLEKLGNQSLKYFLEKYTDRTFPDDRTPKDRKHDGSGNSVNGAPANSVTDTQESSCDNMSVALSPDQVLGEETELPSSPSNRPESYKLSHNNHLSLVLEALAGDESFMDVTLTAEGKSIKAHKSVLSAVSPYFKSVLKSNPCQHPIIIMPRDISFDQLRYIIMYIYRGEMTVAADDLSCLLKTAEILQITGLSPADSSKQSSEPKFTAPSCTKSDSSEISESVSNKRKIESTLPSRKNATTDKLPQKKRRKTNTPVPSSPHEAAATDEEVNVKQEQETSEDLETTDPVKEEFVSDNEEDSAMDYLQMDMDKPESDHVKKDSLLDNLDPDPLSCPYCSEEFSSHGVAETHLSEKHPYQPYNSCSCNRLFKDSKIYDKHKMSCPEGS